MRKSLYLLLTGFIFCLGIMLVDCKTMAATDEETVLTFVNEERVSNGLEPLSIDSDLQRAAQVRANEASVSYSHQRPDGSEYYTVSIR